MYNVIYLLCMNVGLQWLIGYPVHGSAKKIYTANII